MGADDPFLVAEACPPDTPATADPIERLLKSMDARLADMQARQRRWFPLRTIFGRAAVQNITSSLPAQVVLAEDPLRYGCIIFVPTPGPTVYMGLRSMKSINDGNPLVPGSTFLFGQECPEIVALLSGGADVLVSITPILRADGVAKG
jgi:hypothetical protein